MANEVVGVQIKVDSSQATKSLGEIRKEIKQANADLINAQQNFGDYSAEALAAAKKVATLKDSIKEAAETADLFDPGNKFKAFAGALSAVAGGFSAVQGAVGLLGVKSEEVEKSILKVQSALALSQGLSTVADSAKDFQRLAAIVKTNVVTAFSTLRGAIIATGIGALAVGLGLLIANFDKVKKVVLELIPGLGKVADFIGGLINKITDFIGVTSDASRATAKLIEDNNKAIKEAERFLDLNADKYDEYTQRKIKANLEFKKKQNEFLADETLSETQKIEFVKQARDKANREIIKSDADRNAAIKAQNKKAFDDAEAQRKKNEQLADEKRKAEIKKIVAGRLDQEEFLKGIDDKRKESIKSIEPVILGQLDKQLRGIGAVATAQTEAAQKKNKEDEDSKNAVLEKEKAKQDAYLMTGVALSALGDLVGRETAAGKALSAAQALINTFVGITQVLKNDTVIPEPFGTIQKVASVATILATGLSAVKNIAKTKVPGGGGGGGSVGTPRFSTLAPPIAPQAPTAALTQLNQQSINQLGSATNRAYVVESDISNSQERITRINRAARLA